MTSHLQKLGEVFGGLGLKCSGSDGGDESDGPSPAGEDVREEAEVKMELPAPAGPPASMSPASSSSDSSDSEEK